MLIYLKNPKLVQSLLKTLPYSAMPLKVGGVWRSPKLSRRKLAELKKAAIYHGFEWPMKEEPRQFKKHGFIKPQKGRAADRKHDDRIDTIAKKLQGQIEKMQKIRDEARRARYKDPDAISKPSDVIQSTKK